MAGQRRDTEANTGCVKWPTHLRSTGEGGMFVTAHWTGLPSYEDDARFVACSGPPNVYLERVEIPLDDDPLLKVRDDTIWSTDPMPRFSLGTPEQRWKSTVEMRDWTRSDALLAAVTLGTSGGSWASDDPDPEAPAYWYCSRDDLTWEGKTMLEFFDRLYGTEGRLITWLDT